MKLKKIITKKYDKGFELLKTPSRFSHDFYYFTYSKSLIIFSIFNLYQKRLSKLMINKCMARTNKLIVKNYYERKRTYTYTFPLTISILVHFFLFCTFFFKTYLLLSCHFRHEVYKLEIAVYFYEPKKKTKIKTTNHFKNFYIPFIYFLAFKSLEA